MPTQDKAAIIRAIFAAYLSNDRKAVEDAFTDDFRFTSPYDDEIDKATYFVRCWRVADWIERHELEKILVGGNEAFVTYKSSPRTAGVSETPSSSASLATRSNVSMSISAPPTRTVFSSGRAKADRSCLMSLTLHFHPLASYCHKVLIALYENDTPFTPNLVDLSNETARAALLKLWPIGKFPVLRDDARNETVPESTVIIEYFDRHYPGRTQFIPGDADRAWQTRLRDRFYDLYVHEPMQKIVGDRLRPEGKKDSHGVEEAKARLRTSYRMIDQAMAMPRWAMGDAFSLADCAAAPALFYANEVMPFGESHKNVAAYLDRLKARPSYARVLKEAEPYFAMFPR